MHATITYLERAAQRCPQKTAVIDEQTSLTYQDLRSLARRCGTSLIRTGVQRKQPVPVLMEKSARAFSWIRNCRKDG